MTTAPSILVLLHVPRTGGTTLHQAFSARFAPGEICPERMNRLDTRPAEEIARYRLFSGHHRFDELALMPAPRLAVTVLREPRARLVSLYRHWRRHWAELAEGNEGLRLAQALSLRAFLRCGHIEVAEAFDNAMARQLAGDCRARGPGRYTPWAWEDMTPVSGGAIVAAACRNLERLQAVGFADALDALHGFVAERLGWTVHGPLPRLNGHDQPAWGVHAVPRAEVPPDAMEEIERMTRLDQAVWEFARARAGGAALWRTG